MDNHIFRSYRLEDREDVLNLLEIVWGTSFKEKMRKIWPWKIENNPFKTDKISQATLLVKDNAIVGLISKMPVPLKLYGKTTKGVWLCDYVVHPEHHGWGHKLMKTVMKDPAILLGEPNDHSYKVVKKLGFSDIYTPQNRICIINLNNLLKNKRIGNSLFQYACGKVWNGFYYCFRSISAKTNGQMVIEKINKFDADIDTFWERIKHQYAIAVIRKKEFLNWRYSDRPDKKYVIYLVKENSQIIGYAVTRAEINDGLNFGHIVDICCDLNRKDAFSFLINRVTNDFEHIKKVDLITCYFPPIHPFYDKALKKCGFFFKNFKRHFVYYNNSSSIGKKDLSNPMDWFLTRGDVDIDMI